MKWHCCSVENMRIQDLTMAPIQISPAQDPVPALAARTQLVSFQTTPHHTSTESAAMPPGCTSRRHLAITRVRFRFCLWFRRRFFFRLPWELALHREPLSSSACSTPCAGTLHGWTAGAATRAASCSARSGESIAARAACAASEAGDSTDYTCKMR